MNYHSLLTPEHPYSVSGSMFMTDEFLETARSNYDIGISAMDRLFGYLRQLIDLALMGVSAKKTEFDGLPRFSVNDEFSLVRFEFDFPCRIGRDAAKAKIETFILSLGDDVAEYALMARNRL